MSYVLNISPTFKCMYSKTRITRTEINQAKRLSTNSSSVNTGNVPATHSSLVPPSTGCVCEGARCDVVLLLYSGALMCVAYNTYKRSRDRFTQYATPDVALSYAGLFPHTRRGISYRNHSLLLPMTSSSLRQTRQSKGCNKSVIQFTSKQTNPVNGANHLNKSVYYQFFIVATCVMSSDKPPPVKHCTAKSCYKEWTLTTKTLQTQRHSCFTALVAVLRFSICV